MKKIIKLISFALLLAMIFSTVACSKSGDIENGSDSGASSNESSYSPNGENSGENSGADSTGKSTTKKETSKSTDKTNTTPVTVKTVKGYLLSASSPSDTYGNGMFLAYKLTDGRLLVYDGGNASVKNFMIEALQTIAGTKKVKVAAWVMTHDHGDHYGALIEYYYANASTINQVLEVEEFWMNPMIADGYNLQNNLKKAFPQASFRRLVYGEEFMLDKIKVTVLCTPEVIPSDSRNDVNTYSLVTMLNIGGKKILMTGDANEPAWDFMVRQQSKGDKFSLKCDFLQVPHHGVHAAGTAEGYAAASPRYLVIPSTVDLTNWLTTTSNAKPSYDLYAKHGITPGGLKKETDNMTYWFAGCYGKSGTTDIKCFMTYKETN